jgi:hypothetical protein
MMTVHKCKVECHVMPPSDLEAMGLPASTESKWLPFIFDMGMVRAAKLSTDEEDHSSYNCTTIFTHDGDSFIIDTPFEEFSQKFVEYSEFDILGDFKKDDDTNDDDDLIL